MDKKILVTAVVLILGFSIGIPNSASAGNLPETPITRILSYKTGLDLTDNQVKNLNLINTNIINKMLQVRAQLQNHKNAIEQAGLNWADLDSPRVKGSVKEFYKCRADMKTLELEAMAQASKILSEDQIKRFNELATIELIMRDMEEEMASAY